MTQTFDSQPPDVLQWHSQVDFSHATQLYCCDERIPASSSAVGFDVVSTPVIAFDLDETLLVNSWVEPAHFAAENCCELISAWKKWTLPWCVSQTQAFRGQRFIRPLIDRCGDRDRAVAGTVKLQMRRGALDVLKTLRLLGFLLVLVTASAKKRVDYLFARIPALNNLFSIGNSLQVICAEDLQRAALAHAARFSGNLESIPSRLSAFQRSAKLHQAESPSLAWKTPLLVQSLLGNRNGYDLLVDDNIDTRNAFDRHGLSDAIVPIDGMAAPDSPLMFEVAEEIARRLDTSHDVKRRDLMAILAEMRESEPRPNVWLEDPFYLPLLRRRLQLEEGTDA